MIILGFVFVGIGASIYYGELGLGSLTKSGTVQQSGDAWGYLPVGLGVALMVLGFLITVLDHRAG